MEQIVVKTEVQPNGDILLFYVDENQSHGVGELTRIENVPTSETEQLQQSDFVLSNIEESVNEYGLLQTDDQFNEESWQDEEIQKLLVFYIDNKDSFCNADTENKHLWIVACKTMLNGKNPSMCELKLLEMKQSYSQICMEQQQGNVAKWPYYDLCHQAFHDNESVKTFMDVNIKQENMNVIPIVPKFKEEGILVMKKVNSGRTITDEKVELMLNLYLKYKRNIQKYHTHRGIWDAIAVELGQEDADYWHKRFLNFKQHYIRMVCKRNETGPEKINWPYMKLFDQIFDGDEEFQRKFGPRHEMTQNINGVASAEDTEIIWNDTERTVLVKYYFDCFHEFQDPTIPNNFLWHEIGRLLEKKPENCKQKYREMKREHFEKLTEGEYDLINRIPIEIILDNIIAREIEIEFRSQQKRVDQFAPWKTEEIDKLVQFIYDNIEIFKDSVCYYVSWSIVANKLKKNIHSCKKQWEDLTTLYKSILEDKKENPDMQIDWRYIDIFDRIFDYGMDTNLLEGYENVKAQNESDHSEKVGARKVHIKDEEDNDDFSEDEESYDERGYTKRSKRRLGESKGFKILEYYLRNKDKFSCSLRKKLSLWEVLARQLGITAAQCAHRFRNLKQVYTGYVQREINKPDMPILWPYYALCKKVFGYRAIKSRLKSGKMDSDDAEEWTAREIKQVINHYSSNCDSLRDSAEDVDRWSPLASQLGKTARACCEKFLELRKSYRKLKTMKSRNPEVKVSWKYFNMMDDIFSSDETRRRTDETDATDNVDIAETMDVDAIKTELPDDEEFEYIIVIPEDQELGDNDVQVTVEGSADDTHAEDAVEVKPQINKWNRRTKKRLLIHYLKYLRSHRGKEIDSRDMWREISSKLNKSPSTCRRILIKLKNQHRLSASSEEFKTKSPYYSLIEKILSMKPKFAKISQDKRLQENRTYKDVAMADEKVERALQYYLDCLEEFLSPRFEKKYVWMELANAIDEPVSKVFNKVNYLKHLFDSNPSAGQGVPFSAILQEISVKESLLKNGEDFNDVERALVDDSALEEFWSDDEVESLLTWYLANLDKFKNPKYVRSYLWMGASEILKKSPLICSKKMSEIRTQYRNMVREAPEELSDWRFHNLCQKIYGTGKKPASIN
ncbi:unnamed protein product, partial [Iphiclides podalirius]